MKNKKLLCIPIEVGAKSYQWATCLPKERAAKLLLPAEAAFLIQVKNWKKCKANWIQIMINWMLN